MSLRLYRKSSTTNEKFGKQFVSNDTPTLNKNSQQSTVNVQKENSDGDTNREGLLDDVCLLHKVPRDLNVKLSEIQIQILARHLGFVKAKLN